VLFSQLNSFDYTFSDDDNDFLEVFRYNQHLDTGQHVSLGVVGIVISWLKD